MCLDWSSVLSVSVFPPRIPSSSQAPGSVLIAPGEVCDGAEHRGLRAFLVFVLHISEFLELRFVYRGTEGKTRGKQSVLKKHKGEEKRGVVRPMCPKQLCWEVVRAPKGRVMGYIQDTVCGGGRGQPVVQGQSVWVTAWRISACLQPHTWHRVRSPKCGMTPETWDKKFTERKQRERHFLHCQVYTVSHEEFKSEVDKCFP